jgi:peptidoglycan/xylan/chitin deacetylase (PgdA/CDA1 family)
LKKYQIPATIFLTTSFVDKSPQFGKLIWTDYIYCLLESTRLSELDLRDEGLGRFELNSQESKYAAKGFICEWLKKLDSERKNLLIRKLTERLSCTVTPEQEQVFGSIDWDDVQRLDREGLVTFGAHTVNHEILSQLPDDKAKWELTESQRIIESKVNRPVPLFAYPNGQPDDFTETVQATVRAHYRCALTTLPETNSVGDDLYMLKRTGVGRGLALWEFELLMAGVPQG